MQKTQKQMMDIDKKTAMTPSLSNEHQRNWDDDLMTRKVNNPIHNYDPSRMHLNFQITKGGRITPIDTSKNICQKIDERIAQGVTAKNSIRSTSHRSVLVVFGGNRERMRELAFGHQLINPQKGKNAHLTRCRNIEKWARDVYRFACTEWGEANIASFIVHLDELNPHAHCVVVPITKDGHLSCKSVFGGADKAAARENLCRLHDHFAVVSERWGLDRGDDINITGAEHISLDEHHRFVAHEVAILQDEKEVLETDISGLERQKAQAEKALKGLQTMVENLEGQRDSLAAELYDLYGKISEGRITMDEFILQQKEIEAKLDDCNKKLEDKQQKIDAKTKEFMDIIDKINLFSSHRHAFRIPSFNYEAPHISSDPPRFSGVENWKKEEDAKIKAATKSILSEYARVVMKAAQDSIHEERLANLRKEQDALTVYDLYLEMRGKINDMTTGIDELLSLLTSPVTGRDVIGIALALAEGSDVVIPVSGGGSTSSSETGWDGKRRDDEDDQEFLRRCFFHASKMARMMHPAQRKKNNGRGR